MFSALGVHADRNRKPQAGRDLLEHLLDTPTGCQPPPHPSGCGGPEARLPQVENPLRVTSQPSQCSSTIGVNTLSAMSRVRAMSSSACSVGNIRSTAIPGLLNGPSRPP